MKQLKIGGYLRVSTEEQAALVDGSLDNQRYRMNAFVDLKNVQEPKWGKIVEFYMDDGYSAKDTRRPAFQRMMADLKRGKINLILVNDLSRLSRNIPDFCGILESLKENDASFLSIKEQFDSTTPAGKMMLYNMINLAQFEREQTSERVALGCHARAMRGLLNGGHEILGFDKVAEKKSTYVVNEIEAEQVRTAFRTFLECGTLSRTASRLQELGIKPKVKANRAYKVVDRGLWTHQSLGDVLKNSAYIGKREVNRGNKGVEPSSLKAHQQYQIVKATWPAIVDVETFEAVQRLLQDNKAMERRRLRGAERRVFTASGILCCKECGRPMIGQSAHGDVSTHRYYAHSYSKGDVITCAVKRIRADDVEEAIARHISTVLRDGKYLDGVAEKIAGQGAESREGLRGLRAKIQKSLKDAEMEMETAFKFQAKADPESESARFFMEKIEALGKKKAVLKTELERTEESADNVISLADARRGLEDRVEMVAKGWRKLQPAQQKRALRRLIQKIQISEKGLDIHYYFNAIPFPGKSDTRSKEVDSPASVLNFRARGTENSDSKRQVFNCLSAGLAIPA